MRHVQKRAPTHQSATMKNGKSNRGLAKPLAIIAIMALLARLVMVRLFGWNVGYYYEYAAIARFIVEGIGYWWDWYGMLPPQPTASFPPIYTYFVALFMTLFGEDARLFYISQAVLNSFGVFPSYLLGKLLGGRNTGLVAAAIYSFFPEIAFSVVKPVAEPVALPLVALCLYLFLLAKKQQSQSGQWPNLFLTGVTTGLASLIKENVVLLLTAMILSLIAVRRPRWTNLKAASVLIAGALLVIGPWCIRNSLVMRQPTFLRTMFGFNLWRGNHPWGSGTGYLDPERLSESRLDPQYKRYIERNRPSSESGMDKFYLCEAKKFISADWQRYLRLTLRRALYFLTIDPTHPSSRNPLYTGGYFLVLIFGIWGAIALAKRGCFDTVFIWTPLVFFVAYVPVIVLPRYRFFVDWMLALLASVPVTFTLERLKILKRQRLIDGDFA